MHEEKSNHLTAEIPVTLVGASGTDQERAKLCVTLLISPPTPHPPACRALLTLQNALKKGFST